MAENYYLKQEAKKGFKEWSKEGLEFLLNNAQFQDIAIDAYSKLLDLNETIEFKHNDLHYEIFKSVDSGYIVNLYSSDEKDEDGYYLEQNSIDGGHCTGSAKDAIEFML